MLPDLPVTIELYEWLPSKMHFGGCTAAHKKACMFTRFVASSMSRCTSNHGRLVLLRTPKTQEVVQGTDAYSRGVSLRFVLKQKILSPWDFLCCFCENFVRIQQIPLFKSFPRFQPSKIKYILKRRISWNLPENAVGCFTWRFQVSISKSDGEDLELQAGKGWKWKWGIINQE